MKTSSPTHPAEFASAASEEPAAGAPRTRFANHLDRAGIVCSSLCVLHCAVPVVLAGAALMSGARHAHGHAHAHVHGTQLPLQIALVSSSVVIAGFLLGRSYLRQHQVALPLAIFAVAVVLVALAWLVPWPTDLAAMGVSTLGLLALVAAQVLNVVVLRQKGVCFDSPSNGERRCAERS